jgi:hypothetical protein
MSLVVLDDQRRRVYFPADHPLPGRTQSPGGHAGALIHRRLSLPIRDWRRRWDDWLERGHQRRQIFRDDLPHDVFVNPEVIVDDFVAHADDVGPRDLRVLVRELSGHLAPSFTDDLNEMSQREAFFAMSSMCPT